MNERAVQEMNDASEVMDGVWESKVAANFASASTTIPLYMYLVAATASLNSIDYGFDIGVSSKAQQRVSNSYTAIDNQKAGACQISLN